MQESIIYGYGETPFGDAFIALKDDAVCFLWFVDDIAKPSLQEKLYDMFKNINFISNNKLAQKYLTEIFIENKTPHLYIKATDFQKKVYNGLLNYPKNTILSYQDLANFLNMPKAIRAVASALAKNNIAYLIPCHKVISKSGKLSGYRWNLQRKEKLIAHLLKK